MPPSRRQKAVASALLAFLLIGPAARGQEVVTVATYNIEHFQNRFIAHELGKKLTKEQKADPVTDQMLYQLRKANDEDNWETAQVIADPAVNPDVLVVQEGCTQDNLEYFNKRWLGGAFATLITFPTNTGERNQHLNMLLKPGFKVLKRQDQYHLENDTGDNGRRGRLFARGPAFVLVETPAGYRFWVGVTHQKSKVTGFGFEEVAALRKANAGQPKAAVDEKIKAARDAAGRAAADWRNRESKRTHEIMRELAAAAGPAGADGSDDVLLMGDMNDDPGQDEYEKLAGADAIDLLVGPKADGFFLITRPLVEAKEISFGGYSRPDYRSFIDHAVATPGMRDQIVGVSVFRGGLAAVASDHYPVVVKVRSDPVKAAAAGRRSN